MRTDSLKAGKSVGNSPFSKLHNHIIITLLVSLVASLLLLKFDVGTKNEKYVETQGQVFNVPTKKVSLQHLTLHTKTSSGSAGISVEDSPQGKNTSDCSHSGVLLCLSVAPQIVADEKVLQIIATVAFFVERNRQQFSYVANTEFNSMHEINLKISGSWFQLYIDNEIREQYRYGVPLGISTSQTNLRVTGFGENHNGSLGDQFVFHTRGENIASVLLFILSLLLLIIYMIKYISDLATKKNMGSNNGIFIQTFTLSGLITSASWLINQGNFVKNNSQFPTSGLFYGVLPRFGDFFQVWGLFRFENLYQTQFPDYPPSQVLVFSALSRVIQSESAFLLLISCSTAVLSALIWSAVNKNNHFAILTSIFLTFSSAPLIYAIDRGGTDLILFPLIVLAVLLNSNARIKTASIFITIATTLKILPLVYLLMFIGRGKSVKRLLSIVAITISLNLIAAFILPEKYFSEVLFYVKHLLARSSGTSVASVYNVFNNSLWAAIRAIDLGLIYFDIDLTSYLNLTWLICVFSLLIFSIYWCLFRAKYDSTKFFIANCILLLVPALAPNYRLLYMYPAIWYIGNTLTFPSPKLKRTFIIASAMLLSISPIYYFGSTGINVGQSLKPFLILTLLMVVCFSDGYHKTNVSQPSEYANGASR